MQVVGMGVVVAMPVRVAMRRVVVMVVMPVAVVVVIMGHWTTSAPRNRRAGR